MRVLQLCLAAVFWMWCALLDAQEFIRPSLTADHSADVVGPVSGDDQITPAWGSAEPYADTRSWPQRIAGLTQGRMQLEGGYSYLRGSVGDALWQQHAVPDMLLRYGLTQRLELRLGWPGYVSSSADFAVTGGSSNGVLDPNVGFLYDLWPEDGWVPQTAVLAAVPLTWEGNPFALDSLQPLAELMYAWQISSGTAVTGRSGLALFDAAGDNFTQFQQSVSVDRILTDCWSGFASWDMVTNIGSVDDTSEHMGGVGLSWLVTERLAISSRVALGLNTAAPDLLFDLRFAYRF